MININKCCFLVDKIKVVGYEVVKGAYTTCEKALGKILKVKIPKDFTEL